MVYIVCVFAGSWDDATWYIDSVWDCPLKADEAKRKKLAEVAEFKAIPEPPTDDEHPDFDVHTWYEWHIKTRDFANITDVTVKEYPVNQ